MSYAVQHDIGGLLSAEFGAVSTTVDSSVDGASFNRKGATSALFVVTVDANSLDSAEDLDITINPQDSADDSSFSDYTRSGKIDAETVATGSSPDVVKVLSVRLDDAREFVRAQVTVTTSSSATDVTWALTYIVGGHDTRPVADPNDTP